jgi:hypothetical protein
VTAMKETSAGDIEVIFGHTLAGGPNGRVLGLQTDYWFEENRLVTDLEVVAALKEGEPPSVMVLAACQSGDMLGHEG